MSVHVVVQKISSKNLFLLVLASMVYAPVVSRFSVTERKGKKNVKKNATLQRRMPVHIACSRKRTTPGPEIAQ